MKRADFLKKMGDWKQEMKLHSGTSTGIGKKGLREIMLAKLHKKKMPKIKVKERKKNPAFAKMTIEEYEAKYK